MDTLTVNKEIERKFLVGDVPYGLAKEVIKIRQGYIFDAMHGVLRVRQSDDDYFLTLKGKNDGISRIELEFAITPTQGEMLFDQMVTESLEKTRYVIGYTGDDWEVDVFHGKLEGLVLAEVELENENQEILIPHWIDKEVSDNPFFYNSKET